MSVLLTAYVVAMAMFAWISLAKIVPDCATSQFRYRVWRLRDALVDDIRHDKYHDQERARKFVSLFERAIEHASELSLLNVIFLHISRPHNERTDPLDLKGLDADDVERLAGYREDFERAVAMKALFGTPSGWIFVAVLSPIALVGWLTKKDHRDGSLLARARRHVVADFELNPAFGRKRRGPLYQHI